MTALPDSLLVDVFKTARRPETFLFLPQGLALADWPEGLADVFTPAEKVLSLNLSARQPLAAQPASRVMEEIASRGYFLQLPPDPVKSAAAQELPPC
jgi:uncharacterized protein YcgL (UPF0745 family)